MNRQKKNFMCTEFANSVRHIPSGDWTQFSATKQDLKTAKIRLLY